MTINKFNKQIINIIGIIIILYLVYFIFRNHFKQDGQCAAYLAKTS